MALLDFIKQHNAQAPIAQTQQQAPQVEASARSVESLPANVKAQAVEAARPAAKLMDEATAPKANPAPRPEGNQVARGRSLGMGR